MFFTGKSPVSPQCSVNSFRGYTRGCYLALLALLSLFILASILHQRQDYLLCIPLSLQPNIEPSRSIVIRPGDIISKISLEVRPQDDQAPFAHEPVGTGTLRDVRYVVLLVLFHISPTYYHMSFINIFLTPYLTIYREEKFYRGGTLTVAHESDDDNPPIPAIYDPYPEYNSAQWRKEFTGRFHACEGPRGKALSRSSAQDMVSVYPGNQKGNF